MKDDIDSVARVLYKLQSSKDNLTSVMENLNSYEACIKNNWKSPEADYIISSIRECKQYVLRINASIDGDYQSIRKVLKNISL